MCFGTSTDRASHANRPPPVALSPPCRRFRSVRASSAASRRRAERRGRASARLTARSAAAPGSRGAARPGGIRRRRRSGRDPATAFRGRSAARALHAAGAAHGGPVGLHRPVRLGVDAVWKSVRRRRIGERRRPARFRLHGARRLVLGCRALGLGLGSISVLRRSRPAVLWLVSRPVPIRLGVGPLSRRRALGRALASALFLSPWPRARRLRESPGLPARYPESRDWPRLGGLVPPWRSGSPSRRIGSAPRRIGSAPRRIGCAPRRIGSPPRRVGSAPGRWVPCARRSTPLIRHALRRVSPWARADRAPT